MNDHQNKILIADDDAISTAILTDILSPLYSVHIAKNGANALKLAKQLQPDVIILDVVMPDMNGFHVIKLLKEAEDTKDIPVIFITGMTLPQEEEKGLILGAADYIHKPFSKSLIKLRVRNQVQIVNQMRVIQHYSMTDALTNTANRRHFNFCLSKEWQRCIRDSAPISILIIDIDDFKAINDVYGHLTGDAVLQNIAEKIKQCIKRPMDLIARWGGEEFAILLPNTTLDGAILVAEDMLKIVQEGLSESRLSDIHVTLSIGVNTIVPAKDSQVFDFIHMADKALYKAKKTGKNRVCISEEFVNVFNNISDI